MNKLFICLAAVIALPLLSFGADNIIDTVKDVAIEGHGGVAAGVVLEGRFAEPKWSTEGANVIFTGKIKPGSIFPPEEKDAFFDMQYSTIEENQLTGNADMLYAKYISKEPDAVKKRSGYDNKMLLGSEKYYNILEILEEKAIGGEVKVTLALSKEGKAAEIISINAPNLYTHNDDIISFKRFLFQK